MMSTTMKDYRTGAVVILPILLFLLIPGVPGMASESAAAAGEPATNWTDKSTVTAPVMGSSSDGDANQGRVSQDLGDYPVEGLARDQQQEAGGGANGGISEIWSKIRHLRQKVRLKEEDEPVSGDYVDDRPKDSQESYATTTTTAASPTKAPAGSRKQNGTKPFRIQASGSRNKSNKTSQALDKNATTIPFLEAERISSMDPLTMNNKDPVAQQQKTAKPGTPPVRPRSTTTASTTTSTPTTTTGPPRLENKFLGMKEDEEFVEDSTAPDPVEDLELYESGGGGGGGSESDPSSDDEDEDSAGSLDDPNAFGQENKPNLDIVTKFLRIVESQHLLGENCTAGTDFNLGEGVVDRYAQERFRLEAEVAVNRANWLTRLWKYADLRVLHSEYLLHANLYSMIEMDEDIFAAGNCYDKEQYKNYTLFCPFAYRLLDGTILAKDLAVEYKYLANTSEWFYIARKNAERVIRNNTSFTKAYHTYTANETSHTEREVDEILSVSYEDGKWSKPYFDCGGGNIWMMTYTVPFFGFANDTYFFKGTSGIDIDLRRVDIDQCPQRPGNTQLNIFAASDKCKPKTTKCVHIPGLGFRRGSYRCECKDGFYFPDKTSSHHYYNGAVMEEEYEKKLMDVESLYDQKGTFECLPCPEGCDVCVDDSPCIVTLNWVMRTTILILEIIVICCLPVVALFTWRYNHIKVVRAASPALLRLIILGAFFIYCTILVAYTRPNMITCSLRVWLREIGFAFAYGALMLKTWRISVIFRVRSAKAVKITDLDLIKRLGIIVSVFAVFLSIRTIVGPPQVIVARTADDLKAYICQTDWWDHVFTAMEMMVLVWGIRLCIVVRKAPSEFNESRFISMAIYNEFLLSIFLNVSMLFLQSPANPDLMYIIMFSHTQLTTTLLLVLIFASKAYLVLRGRGKGDDNSTASKPQAAKFLPKPKSTTSNVTPSMGSFRADIPELSSISDPEIQAEIRRLLTELDQLREKTVRNGHTQFAARLIAMSQAARQAVSPSTVAATVPAVNTITPDFLDPASASSAAGQRHQQENGPSLGGTKAKENNGIETKKTGKKNKRTKQPPSPDGLGSLMFGGPKVNNVLACMTDKIVCATFSADPNAVAEDDEEEDPEAGEDVEEAESDSSSSYDETAKSPVSALAPASSLALAAAPLLTTNFAFDTRGSMALRIYSAPSSRRGSDQPLDAITSTSPTSVRLSLVGDHTNSGALFYHRPTGSISVHSLCHLTTTEESGSRQSLRRLSESGKDGVPIQMHPLSPRIRRKSIGDNDEASVSAEVEVGDSSVRSAQVTPAGTPGPRSSVSSSKSRINTEDRERFTEEVTV